MDRAHHRPARRYFSAFSAFKNTAYDVVMIGAGVRKDDDHFLIFEKLVNVVHEHAPKARIAFNTGPTDSDVAIRRWA